MSTIRFGIIRCDLHAIYYANVMQAFDPDVLYEPQYGMGGHYYFHQGYHDPRKITQADEESAFKYSQGAWGQNTFSH